jgi:DnaK suppressor protein
MIMSMENKKIEEYKNKLKKEQAMIEEELRQNSRPPEFNVEGDRDDKEEEADQDEAISNQVALVSDLKTRLADIELALEKISTDRYGVCENCGKKISEDVLDIDPESQLCRECKLNV